MVWRLVGCAAEVPVAQTASASVCNNQLFAIMGNLTDDLSGLRILDDGSGRHFEDLRVTIFSTTPAALSVLSMFCLDKLTLQKLHNRFLTLVHTYMHLIT